MSQPLCMAEVAPLLLLLLLSLPSLVPLTAPRSSKLRSSDQLGLPRNDAYSLYLAYHDGVGGFRRGTWRSKGWLKDAARRVAQRAQAYETQLRRCEDDLDGPWWWPF